MIIELDCREMTDKPALDALYDVLTERGEQTELVLKNWRALSEQLGGYGISLLETLRQASEENPHLEVTLAAEI